jgi:hypothetical protein
MSRLFDLEAEMRSAGLGVDNRVISWLLNNGCTAAGIATIGVKQAPFGVSKVDMRGKHTFEPTTEAYGVSALIMPVMHDGTIIDQIAWRSLRPDLWLWRIGAGWALGIDEIESPPLWEGFKEITLHATPLDWLRAGGEGAVVLDWNAIADIRKLAMFDTIRCDHSTVQRQLSAILSQPERKPRIVGTGAKRERAA